MRILITGGQGTVGQVLTYWLRRSGHEVWTCDLNHHHDARHLRCDIAEFRQVSSLFEREPFALVYHLAAEYGRWNGEDYYEQLWRTNVIGTKHLIRMQEKLGFRMVFTSTSEVYGDVGDAMSEDLLDRQEVRQLNDYALSKWVNEQQLLNSAAMSGTETVRVRLFNIYGPGEYFTPYRSAICRFAYSALLGLPYTVFLNHQRTSLFVSDAVRTMAKLVDTFQPGEVFNIGGTCSHDMKQVSDIILAQLGKDDAQVTYAEAEPFTTRNKRLDSAKTTRSLGHAPAVSLEAGLGRTLEWMRRVYVEETNEDPNKYPGVRSMNVLAIGAHHDDIELGCGGTLAKLARDGHSTFGLTLTNSETNYEIEGIHRTRHEARSEAERSAKVLGLKLVELDGTDIDNGALVYEVQLMRRIERLIHDENISLVFSHWSRDLNTDHEAAAKLTLVASRHVPRVLMYRSNGYQASQPFNATVFVDISETIETKRHCLECFESELKNRKQEWIESFFDAHRSAGFGLGKGYAEVFEPIRCELF